MRRWRRVCGRASNECVLISSVTAAIASATAAAVTATAAAAAWAARATAAAVTVAPAAVACAIAAVPLHAPRSSRSSCRQSGRWTRATAAAVAVAAAAVACATAAAVAVAAAAMAAAVWQQSLHAPRQLLPRSQLQLLHAQRQVMSQPWQRSGRRTQPSFRASVAPWRVGNSAREDASPVCRRFAAWHAARLMPPALRRSTCAGLAAVGASTRRTWRTAQEGRARRAPAKGICVGHAAAGSEAQDEPEALRRRGPAAAAQTACCTLQ